jgi:tetratricopeptide (TPR) repeat protein
MQPLGFRENALYQSRALIHARAAVMRTSRSTLPYILLFPALWTACASSKPAENKEATAQSEPARPPRRPGQGPSSGGGGQRELEEARKAARAKDFDTAIAKAQAAIEKNPNLEEAYLLLADSCAMKDDGACERQAYDRGIAALPRSAALLDERGLWFVKQGDMKSAVKDLEGAAEISQNRDAKILADLAYTYIFVDRLADAESLASKACEIDPKSYEAANALGEVLLHEKKAKEAIAALKSADKNAPDDDVRTDLRAHLALAYSLNNQHEDALAIYEALLKNGGRENPLIHVQIAGELMKLNRAKDAVGHMQEALKKSPDDVRFLSLLMQTQEKAGDKKGAQATKKRLEALGAKP